MLDRTPLVDAADDLERHYNARAAVPEHPAIFERWSQASIAARARHKALTDIRYGDGPAMTLDVYRPEGASDCPVLVYLRGGYWQGGSKAMYGFFTDPFIAAGVMVVVPDYDLCPAVRLGEITEEMRTCLVWLGEHLPSLGGDPDHVHLAGHSAGGHLVAEMLATDWPALDPGLPRRYIRSGLAISGLFDLAPLIPTSMNQALRLDTAEAEANSPVLRLPPIPAPLALIAGGDEPGEFHRQNDLLMQAWGLQGMPITRLFSPHTDHFTVVDTLADPTSPATEWLLHHLQAG